MVLRTSQLKTQWRYAFLPLVENLLEDMRFLTHFQAWVLLSASRIHSYLLKQRISFYSRIRAHLSLMTIELLQSQHYVHHLFQVC